MHLGIDFYAFFVDYGVQFGRQKRLKIDPERHQKNDRFLYNFFSDFGSRSFKNNYGEALKDSSPNFEKMKFYKKTLILHKILIFKSGGPEEWSTFRSRCQLFACKVSWKTVGCAPSYDHLKFDMFFIWSCRKNFNF